MKKFWKFVGGIVSMAAVAFGAYCVYKNVITKKEEDFDDFDDCFEDENAEDADREYVSINITAEDEATAGEEAAEEASGEEDNKEEAAEASAPAEESEE